MTSSGYCQQKPLRRIEVEKIWMLNIFPVLSGRQERGLEKQRNQWKASLCGSSVCSERLTYVPYEFNINSNLHKQYITSLKKDRLLHTHTHPTNLPFKWTVMSSSKHEPSRQQGVVTPPRPLVQSARLLPARLGTAE